MDIPQDVLDSVEKVPEEVKPMTDIEIINRLEIKLKAMETLANQYKKSIPHILKVGKPLHLSLVSKGFIYQLIVPEGAIATMDQFPEIYSILLKFGVLISNIETDSAKQNAAMQAKAEKIKSEQVKKED